MLSEYTLPNPRFVASMHLYHSAAILESLGNKDRGFAPLPNYQPEVRRKSCLCNFICKGLDFRVFPDKDYEPLPPPHNPSLSQKVPGVVACSVFSSRRKQ